MSSSVWHFEVALASTLGVGVTVRRCRLKRPCVSVSVKGLWPTRFECSLSRHSSLSSTISCHRDTDTDTTDYRLASCVLSCNLEVSTRLVLDSKQRHPLILSCNGMFVLGFSSIATRGPLSCPCSFTVHSPCHMVKILKAFIPSANNFTNLGLHQGLNNGRLLTIVLHLETRSNPLTLKNSFYWG